MFKTIVGKSEKIRKSTPSIKIEEMMSTIKKFTKYSNSLNDIEPNDTIKIKSFGSISLLSLTFSQK